ncbi:hypothetical protein [Paenibacillus agricola]|uniref:Uncharacterized protein n=1 Tax=Paenibacillus agricola TaxID=2716264 RepID=A0ABX0J687_9BACL|nr:hypothetical protein [Paenibacillus agricola]NHN29589.1 hypothetical protein [Paenibacillus agricola]
MSRLLANLFLFCDTNKESTSKLRITNYAHVEETIEYDCRSIEFEMTPYDSLNIVVNKGEGTLSFMLQNCVTSFEERESKVNIYHSNQLYLVFEFIN